MVSMTPEFAHPCSKVRRMIISAWITWLISLTMFPSSILTISIYFQFPWSVSSRLCIDWKCHLLCLCDKRDQFIQVQLTIFILVKDSGCPSTEIRHYTWITCINNFKKLCSFNFFAKLLACLKSFSIANQASEDDIFSDRTLQLKLSDSDLQRIYRLIIIWQISKDLPSSCNFN